MASLQDQLLKAGLIDKKKATQVNKEKRKKSKVERRSKEQIIDETKASIQQSRVEKVERDRELNHQRQEEANKKAIAAQIKQLIQINKLKKVAGEVGYNFVDENKIKKLYITDALQNQLSLGRLAIVKLLENNIIKYELVPTAVAEKIALRDEKSVVLINAKTEATADEDDPYADYKIPDDLMW